MFDNIVQMTSGNTDTGGIWL